MKLFKKHRKYSQMEQLVNLYEERMVRLYHFEKYKKAGKLLLASAAPGEVVYLISETNHIADLFNRIKRCRVLSVSFISDNSARVKLIDLENGKEYIVKNNDAGKIFFADIEQAEVEFKRKEMFLQQLIQEHEREERNGNRSESCHAPGEKRKRKAETDGSGTSMDCEGIC